MPCNLGAWVIWGVKGDCPVSKYEVRELIAWGAAGWGAGGTCVTVSLRTDRTPGAVAAVGSPLPDLRSCPLRPKQSPRFFLLDIHGYSSQPCASSAKTELKGNPRSCERPSPRFASPAHGRPFCPLCQLLTQETLLHSRNRAGLWEHDSEQSK